MTPYKNVLTSVDIDLIKRMVDRARNALFVDKFTENSPKLMSVHVLLWIKGLLEAITRESADNAR